MANYHADPGYQRVNKWASEDWNLEAVQDQKADLILQVAKQVHEVHDKAITTLDTKAKDLLTACGVVATIAIALTTREGVDVAFCGKCLVTIAAIAVIGCIGFCVKVLQPQAKRPVVDAEDFFRYAEEAGGEDDGGGATIAKAHLARLYIASDASYFFVQEDKAKWLQRGYIAFAASIGFWVLAVVVIFWNC